MMEENTAVNELPMISNKYHERTKFKEHLEKDQVQKIVEGFSLIVFH